MQLVAFRRAAGTDNWRTAIAAVLPIWLVVRAAVAVVSLVVMWTRNGPSVTDRAGSPVLDTAGDGFFAVLAHWDSGTTWRSRAAAISRRTGRRTWRRSSRGIHSPPAACPAS